MRTMDSGIGCVVLAAGSSERMGQPKALLRVGDGNLVSWLARRLLKQELEPVIVTNEQLFDDILESTGCEVICNPDPKSGRTGTVQLGIRRVGLAPGRKFLIVPIDRPGFSDSTLTSLLAANTTTCPASNGRGGHPLLLSEGDASRILEVAPSVPLKELIEPVRIEVSDPHLHLNVDKTSDLLALEEAFAELR